VKLRRGGERESEVGHGMKMMRRVGWVVKCGVTGRKHMWGTSIKCRDLWS
jgi:hypothetical protein